MKNKSLSTEMVGINYSILSSRVSARALGILNSEDFKESFLVTSCLTD